MLSNKDVDFLKWIGQRLVNRYNEDPKIILYIEEIIEKISAEISVQKELNLFVSKSIASSIQNLQAIISYVSKVPQIVDNQVTQKTIDKNKKTFENLDTKNIF
jgi:hypothetical protein